MNCETHPSSVVRQFQVVRQLVKSFFLSPPLRLLRSLALVLGGSLALSVSAQNRVLELDGNNSYVELPPNIFRNLNEATVEVWAKWDRFNTYSRVFEFGASFQSMSVFNHYTTGDLRFNLYPKYSKDNPAYSFVARANGVLRSNEWIHIAAVSGPGGMKLYANGEVVAMHTNEACLAAINAEQINVLGRGLARNPGDHDFRGQIDEVRVWNHRRSPEQIRENMHRRLTGREEGLVGLWNFDDAQATDLTSGAHHGKLIGNARIVTPDFPAGLKLIASELTAAPAAAPAPAAPPVPAAAPERNVLYWWIAGALTLIVALLAWLGFTLKRNAQVNVPAQLPPPATTGDKPTKLETAASPDLKERALAELTEFAKQSLVQGLYSQRNALLETQQQAQRELAELEARLLAMKLPDRILAYEKRILELERELESRTGELRELTNATLSLLRRKVEEERELDRATRRFN
ncbi:MAG: hypothetical protein QM813_14035 [Verrucomicrobiota bacterium]